MINDVESCPNQRSSHLNNVADCSDGREILIGSSGGVVVVEGGGLQRVHQKKNMFKDQDQDQEPKPPNSISKTNIHMATNNQTRMINNNFEYLY